MAKKKFLVDSTNFIAKHLVSATVETGAKSDVVVTFSPVECARRFTNAVKTEFTLVGKTVDHIHVSEVTGTVIVNVTNAYGAGAGFDLTYNPAKKGDTVVIAVDNNIT
jgi:hypothetical protein